MFIYFFNSLVVLFFMATVSVQACVFTPICPSMSGPQNILMQDYEHIAIATDLEPDDVLALKIIFQEANRLYDETGNYPIHLVIVGEGNVGIKKLRMQALLDYMNLPDGVVIRIEEGKATKDNIFPLDGQELFSSEELQKISFRDHSEYEGSEAMRHFLAEYDHPLIIQLKPAQELLSINPELSKKAAIFFYGSFNFRKTIWDESFQQRFPQLAQSKDQEKLQALLDHFERYYKKVGILESYGILGEESAVYSGYPWTDVIRNSIEDSQDDFMIMFKKLVNNWNRYLLYAELPSIKAHLNQLSQKLPEEALLEKVASDLDELIQEWNESLFIEMYAYSMPLMQEIKERYQSEELLTLIDEIERGIKFADKLKPGSGVQFTLSDVAVALALSDATSLLKATKVKIHINSYGYIDAVQVPYSNIIYYNRVDRDKLAQTLLEALSRIEAIFKSPI